MVKGAWVTLATNDSYSLGALVLAHSLKQVGTQQELAILVTPGVTNSMRARLSDVFNIVREVNILDSRDKANLKLLQRPELGITFTKLHCWQLTDYEKCVFLDADTLVLQNCDELFEREELSAAPDVGWPDCFNSGVFVYRPSEETYNSLIQFALDKGSFDGGDQGLLNLYFSDWARKDISKHLPFIYNVCSTAFYSYLPAFKQFGKDVKIIHFIGNAKPWLQYFDTESKKVRPSRDLGHLEPILQRWWNIFCSMIHPNLSPDMSTSYPSDHVSARSPDQSPQQPYIAPPSPIECTNDITPNVWDPWEEYDRNQMSVTLHSPEHLESHNTTALSSVATEHSNPFLDVPPVDRHDQHDNDSSTLVEHFHDDQSGTETFPESDLKQAIFVENSFFPSIDTHEDVSHLNYQIDHESLRSSPVPHPQENCLGEIPCEVSISDENPIYVTSFLHEETFHEIQEAIPEKSNIPVSHIPEEIPLETFHIPEKIPIPTSHVPSKHETEEDSNNVPCEVENHVKESGLAGAFAKLTLGQQRTPEQEALEDSLRRQNWEQGNIDYLGKDSFDNIWSKICETLAKGPQDIKRAQPQVVLEDHQGNGQVTKKSIIDDSTSPENEDVSSAQIKSDDLEQASPQQEPCAPTKEDVDVLSASQEIPLATDSSSLPTDQKNPPSGPNSSSLHLAISCDNDPKQTPPKDPSPHDKPSSESASSASEKISSSDTEKTSESKNVPTTIEQAVSEKVLPSEEATKSVVSSVDKISYEKLPSPLAEETSESASTPVEQTTAKNFPPVEEGSKPEIVPISTQQTLSEGPPSLIMQSVSLSAKQAVQEKVPSAPVADASVPSPEVPKQDIPIEEVLLASKTVSPTQQAPPTEQAPSEVPMCPLKETPPVEETTTLELSPSSPAPQASLLEQVVKQEIAVSPKVGSTKESAICELAKASALTEPSEPVKVLSEKIPQPLSPSEEKVATSPTQVAPIKQEPTKPEQISSEKISQPTSLSEEKVPPSLTQTVPPREVPPSPEQVPSEIIPQPSAPSEEKVSPSPTQTAPSKTEEIASEEVPQPLSSSEVKVSPSPIQTAPLKAAQSQPEGTPQQQVSMPVFTDPTASQPSNVAATSPAVSSEPPPPITPPRKSGGNKKQSKSKK